MPPFASDIFERAQRYVDDRRRLLIGLCAAVAVALIAAIPGLLTSSDGGRSVRTQAFAQVAPTPTVLPYAGVVNPLDTTPSPTTTTTRPALVLGTTFTRPPTTVAHKAAPKPTTKPAAPTPAAPTSTAKSSPPTTTCRNSYDLACGPFRWDPDPGPNAAITGNVTTNSQTVKAGDHVTFTVTGDDPDAAPLQECNIDFGDGQGFHCDPRPAVDPSYCPKQYGPWTPPAKNDGKLNSTWDHQYMQAGTYKVTFNVRSAMQECNNPYASAADLPVTVFVTP
jgi:hypothetical protein